MELSVHAFFADELPQMLQSQRVGHTHHNDMKVLSAKPQCPGLPALYSPAHFPEQLIMQRSLFLKLAKGSDFEKVRLFRFLDQIFDLRGSRLKVQPVLYCVELL